MCLYNKAAVFSSETIVHCWTRCYRRHQILQKTYLRGRVDFTTVCKKNIVLFAAPGVTYQRGLSIVCPNHPHFSERPEQTKILRIRVIDCRLSGSQLCPRHDIRHGHPPKYLIMSDSYFWKLGLLHDHAALSMYAENCSTWKNFRQQQNQTG